MGLSYTESKKLANKTILILAAITIGEVIFALLGKGYIVPDLHFPGWITGVVMIVLSLVKAYLIIYEFMHMKYEVPTLVKTVLLPTMLLIWAVIAFSYEGSDWQARRDLIKSKDEIKISEVK